MKTVKLNLSAAEKERLKLQGVKMRDLGNYAGDEVASLLNVPQLRARQICALIDFQSIPSVGPKFAQDLIDAGYYTIGALRGKDAVELLNDFEQRVGAWADPCLEDQFRLVVHYANNPNSSKQWWDFTAERKAYRQKYGYPLNRPTKAWYQLPQYQL